MRGVDLVRPVFNMFNMIGLRIDPAMEYELEALARQQGRTKSALVREAIERYLRSEGLAEEARRQSLAVSGDRAERDAIRFVEQATDPSSDD
jgi:predicted DNA-binding protein